jgi:prepilin-type N-terminal cleavage/methylation domain-containing protein
MTRNYKIQFQGFTLVEMLVYIAILGVLSTLAINVTLSMTRAFAELRVSRDLNASGSVLMERLTRDIRSAYDVDAGQSTLGTNPGRLMLDTKDSGGANTTNEFYVENGLVKVRVGGVAIGAVMTTSSIVNNFVLRELVNTKSKAIKIEVTISATRGNITESRNFYNTVVLRGTY